MDDVTSIYLDSVKSLVHLRCTAGKINLFIGYCSP
jgi:hypothetical protein